MDNATVTITADGTDAIIIQYVNGSTTTTFDPMTVDGCDLSNSGSTGGVTASVEASLDGDELTITEIISGGGFDINCVVTATRQ